MAQMTVSDVMIPLSDYATVDENASLYEALAAMEKLGTMNGGREKSRALLVLGGEGRVVGKADMLDILKGIEPRYRELARPRQIEPKGTGSEYAKSLVEAYGLWETPLEEICGSAAALVVKELMRPISDSEYITEDAPLHEGINQLVLGQYQALLVTRGGDIVGVLRLGDVFGEICNLVRRCRS